MKLFERSQHSQVVWDEATGELVVRIAMQDAYHHMGVEMGFQYPDLTIVRVKPWSQRSPYPVCPEALQRGQACVGLRLGPGISLLIERRIGGRQGCTHITRLILEACHAAVQGLLARRCLEEGRQGVLPSAEKVAFLEGHGLSVRNACLAYDLERTEARQTGGDRDRQG
jgi:hypothetical protein